MKIAIFTDVFLEVPGGIPSSIKQEREALEKREDEVYIFCPGFRTEGERGVKIVPTNRFLKPNGAPLSKRPKVVAKYILENYPEIKEFDLFHVHYEMGTSLAGLKLGKELKIPVVQTMHGREDSAAQTNLPFGLKTIGASFLNFLHSRSLKHQIKVKKDKDGVAATWARAKMFEIMVNHANAADYVLTPSEHFKKKLERYGVKKKIYVVPNRLPDGFLVKKPKIKKFEAGEELKIIFSSRVSKEKNLILLLKALKKLEEVGENYKYKLEVFGDGNELKRDERFAKRNGLKVKFYGKTKREKIMAKLDEADLVATLSYNFDTQGLTILEASERGVPSLIVDPELAEGLPREGLLIAEEPTTEGIFRELKKIFESPEIIEKKSRVLSEKREERGWGDLTFLEFCDKIGVSAN